MRFFVTEFAWLLYPSWAANFELNCVVVDLKFPSKSAGVKVECPLAAGGRVTAQYRRDSWCRAALLSSSSNRARNVDTCQLTSLLSLAEVATTAQITEIELTRATGRANVYEGALKVQGASCLRL